MVDHNKNNSPEEIYEEESRMIGLLYSSLLGKVLLRILISPPVSKAAGAYLDSAPSRRLIKPFIKRNQLDLSEYPDRPYASFNDFFTRTILPGKRVIHADETELVAPCDGKATVFLLSEDAHFAIKGCDYTLDTLLHDHALSSRYCGGWGVLFRLTVEDYHRYIYPVSGEKGENHRIPGVFHTVKPQAAEARAIYHENTREYTLIETPQFGTVLMMEIGAMLVGRIKNLHGAASVTRGEEKGYFEFGGSSVLLLLEKDRFCPSDTLLARSESGWETPVRQGESVGRLK